MMNGYWRTAGAGLITYFILLAATIPASFVNTLIAHYLDKNIRIADTRGTLWTGSGRLYAMGDLHWQVMLPELLLGRIHIVVLNDNATPVLDLLASPARLELRHVALTVPATLLSDIGEPLKSISPRGRLTLNSAGFSIADRFTGNLDIDWQDASSALSAIDPIGTYRFHVSGMGRRLDLRLDTQAGPLFLSGTGVWSAPGGIHFTGAASSQNDQLSALLNLIGKPAGNGAYALDVDSHP